MSKTKHFDVNPLESKPLATVPHITEKGLKTLGRFLRRARESTGRHLIDCGEWGLKKDTLSNIERGILARISFETIGQIRSAGYARWPDGTPLTLDELWSVATGALDPFKGEESVNFLELLRQFRDRYGAERLLGESQRLQFEGGRSRLEELLAGAEPTPTELNDLGNVFYRLTGDRKYDGMYLFNLLNNNGEERDHNHEEGLCNGNHQ